VPAALEKNPRDSRGSVPPAAASRAAALRREIDDHNRRYYVDDAPTISDAQYDALFRELQELESRHPELVTAESPTQKVGGPARTDFAPVRHAVPMLSIRTETDTTVAGAAKFDARHAPRAGPSRPTPRRSITWRSSSSTGSRSAFATRTAV
jgi:DNA ligase (NAD+)